MHPIKTIAFSCFAAGLTTSLPFYNGISNGKDKSIRSISSRRLEAYLGRPLQSDIDSIERRVLEAKKSLRVSSHGHVKRAYKDESVPEPMNSIVKGPIRSKLRTDKDPSAESTESPLEDEDFTLLDNLPRDAIEELSIELAYQNALEKTREGYQRDVMIAYIREMLPILPSETAEEIVDNAVEAVVSEDMLNWEHQKANLEQSAGSGLFSVPENVLSDAENERLVQTIHQLSSIKADEGLDGASLVDFLQDVLPHIHSSEIESMVAKGLADVETNQDDLSSKDNHPPWTDQSTTEKRKRETGAGEQFDNLADLTPAQLAFREEIVEYLQPKVTSIDIQTIRRIAHEAVLRIVEEGGTMQGPSEQITPLDRESEEDAYLRDLNEEIDRLRRQTAYFEAWLSNDPARIVEKLSSRYDSIGGVDTQQLAQDAVAEVQRHKAAFAAAARVTFASTREYSTFDELPDGTKWSLGEMLQAAAAETRTYDLSLRDLYNSLRTQHPPVQAKIIELVARATFYELGRDEYAEDIWGL